MTKLTQREPPAIRCPPDPAAADLIVRARPHLSERTREQLGVAACDYAHALRAHFAIDHDCSLVLGERNVFRYQSCEPMLLRAAADAESADVLVACVAALTAGVTFELSVDERIARAMPYLERLRQVKARVEDAATCAGRIGRELARVRAIGGPEPEVSTAARALLIHIASEPVLLTGRIELLRYHREQSLSHRHHRYGNLASARLLTPLRESGAPSTSG
jgi:RHH-type proline utilization regulon transcriptional repressor/proline dehydrogenase/delta 1-pyrroline-5-carboxylate dehydrogenase